MQLPGERDRQRPGHIIRQVREHVSRAQIYAADSPASPSISTTSHPPIRASPLSPIPSPRQERRPSQSSTVKSSTSRTPTAPPTKPTSRCGEIGLVGSSLCPPNLHGLCPSPLSQTSQRFQSGLSVHRRTLPMMHPKGARLRTECKSLRSQLLVQDREWEAVFGADCHSDHLGSTRPLHINGLVKNWPHNLTRNSLPSRNTSNPRLIIELISNLTRLARSHSMLILTHPSYRLSRRL